MNPPPDPPPGTSRTRRLSALRAHRALVPRSAPLPCAILPSSHSIQCSRSALLLPTKTYWCPLGAAFQGSLLHFSPCPHGRPFSRPHHYATHLPVSCPGPHPPDTPFAFSPPRYGTWILDGDSTHRGPPTAHRRRDPARTHAWLGPSPPS